MVGAPIAERTCYVYEDLSRGAFDLWLETNGVTTGGEPGPTGEGTGLQRTASGTLRPDTLIGNALTWLQRCRPAVPA